MQQSSKLLKEGSTSAAKHHKNGSDVISKLPDDLIYQIIRHLTLRDAVKASVLLHRWNSVCGYLKDLKFDWVDMFQDAENSGFLETCKRPCTEYRERFVRAVNQFLDFYHGTEVQKFEVSFCLRDDSSDDIDRWVSFAIRMGAKELSTMLLCKKKYCCKRSYQGRYVFRSELFEGRENNLKYLTLGGCILGQNLANQFSCLNTLSLVHVPLCRPQYDLESMFSCLISLKELKLKRCSLPEKLCFGSLTLLNRLRVTSCKGIAEIELSNADLLDFTFSCLQDVVFDLRPVPKLKRFFLAANERQLHYVFTLMPKHAPKMKSLTVETGFNWVLCIPERIIIFRNVAKLTLVFNSDTNFDILKMITILRAFPFLQKLTLETCSSKDMDRGKLEHSEYVHKHLKEVEIGGFYDTSNQIEFAIYLLKHANSLERLVINPVAKFCSASRQSWDEGEREKVYRKLHEFFKNAVLIIH